ncbi:MAG: ISNCY family transposase [Ignavibacteria bacterium]|nr:ISNCY family transposase [Ignavibacteria bacterium]
MSETLTMSTKERQRLQVLGHLRQGKMTVVKAAAALSLSERQMYRVLARYRTQGDGGLIHRSRGQHSNRGYAPEIRMQTLRLYQELYPDYGPTLFAEMLQEYHHLRIDADTLRRWLKTGGQWLGVRAARRHRQKRQRREAIGALVQFDGSFHEWFEDRGPACCLLVAIDDASGRVFMRFAPSENAFDVLMMLRSYVVQFGVPREFYVDFGSVYHAKKKRLTDVARALSRLGVSLIHARSPQAKGRVERSNRTHQDRLLKALRRNNISTIDQANHFLDSRYLREHNTRFASRERLPDVHRSAQGLDLDNIFCFETTRSVNNDYTITLGARFLQLLPSRAPLPPPRHHVTVRRWLDSSLHIFWNDHELKFKYLTARPTPKPRISRPAPLSHPWRDKVLGRKTKRLRYNKMLASKPKSPILPP